MKFLLTVICLTFLTASQSFALSCAPATVEDSFKRHSESKRHYVLVRGQLINKRNVVLGPKVEGGNGARSENFTATFVGHQATRAGFDAPAETTVAVSAGCAAHWCGNVDMDRPMLTFLEVTPHGQQLSVGPCGGSVFYHPKQDQIDSVMQCMRGGVCEPKSR